MDPGFTHQPECGSSHPSVCPVLIMQERRHVPHTFCPQGPKHLGSSRTCSIIRVCQQPGSIWCNWRANIGKRLSCSIAHKKLRIMELCHEFRFVRCRELPGFPECLCCSKAHAAILIIKQGSCML